MTRAAKKASVTSVKDVDLPGMEDRGIPEIDEAAASYLDIMGRRVDLTKQEKESNDKVVEIMKKHDRAFYKFKGIVVNIKQGKTKADVKYGSDDE